MKTKTINNKNNIDDKVFSLRTKKKLNLIFKMLLIENITLSSIKQQPFCNNSNSNINIQQEK